jgi:hypothetical protein
MHVRALGCPAEIITATYDALDLAHRAVVHLRGGVRYGPYEVCILNYCPGFLGFTLKKTFKKTQITIC